MNAYNTTFGMQEQSSAQPERAGKRSGLETADLIRWKSASTSIEKQALKRRKSVPLQHIAEFTAQLSIMLKSGIDVSTALGSLVAQSQNSQLADVLLRVHQSVLAGTTLSESLRRHGSVFDAAFVATVAAGEASGSLADVLVQLSQMQRNELRNRRTMRALMTYPVLLLAVSTSVVAGLVIFVLPRFSGIFAQYDVALPIITQMLISFADELRGRWWLWGPLAIAFVGGGLVWRKSVAGRQTLDAMWVNTAGIRDVCRARLTGRICRLMGIMLSNGVPLLETLRLTRDAVENSLYRALLIRLEDSVVNGRNLASVLQTAEIIPISARDMLVTAESTGNVAEVSRLLGDYYEEEAEAKMRQLVGMIEPALTVGMGLVIAIVVLAVMLPVFDLSSLANRGH
ncbi:type II secretion system F family protein [Bythopirellula polymerisocia]|uniref:Type II secretion system protein F n=1 Tax=Bythopirellula polymerisocia TaxID=2528003 RepID=A0A5C6CYI6_9BACT|nr:type II secretion system F family protein [Bythopirellula polymerisocia]TWU29458.1 Type II secretion system protein F [Bythopirellula polymerisocia]